MLIIIIIEIKGRRHHQRKIRTKEYCWKKQGCKTRFYRDFNPLSSAHFGGVFQAMVKCALKAMKAILKDMDVSDEKLQTAISEAVSLLNSHPITYVTSDLSDLTPLTPNHFLAGQFGGPMWPSSSWYPGACNPQKRLHRIQQLLGKFGIGGGEKFSPALTRHEKWFHPHRNLKEGDVK